MLLKPIPLEQVSYKHASVEILHDHICMAIFDYVDLPIHFYTSKVGLHSCQLYYWSFDPSVGG